MHSQAGKDGNATVSSWIGKSGDFYYSPDSDRVGCSLVLLGTWEPAPRSRCAAVFPSNILRLADRDGGWWILVAAIAAYATSTIIGRLPPID